MTRSHARSVRGLCAAASLLGLIALAATGARAATTFTADITHDQETPPNGTAPLLTAAGAPRPLSFGTATLVLNDAESALTMSATIFNIDVTGAQTPDTNDDLVAAHIHAPAPPGQNGGVRWGFFGAPDSDNNPDNLVVTPFASGVGGTFTSVWDQSEGNAGTTLATNLPAIRDGLSYINFHTVQFGGGEIRGQILPPPGVIPEPGSLALLAGALPGLLVLRRRKR